MALKNIDPIVLGHNNFFGVDHLDQARGAQRAATFERPEAILEMIHSAVRLGAGGMMMSTHPRANKVAEALRSDATLRDELGLYPLLPYIAKYVRQANEKGMVNVVFDQIKGASIGQKLSIFASGGMALVRKDMFQILRTLIQLELAPFQGLNIRAIFLHDVLTDLALGLDMRSVLEFYCEEIGKRFSGAEPAFATKNLPLFVERCAAYGIEKPLVLSHFNKVGFSMNPSREACERCLRENDVQVMAMGTLASGFLKPAEAYEYVFNLPGIESAVVGVSSPAHAEETFGAIRRHVSIRRPAGNPVETPA